MSSKRKSRTSAQKLNRELLDRARQQARALEEADDETEEASESAEPEARAETSRPAQSTRPKRVSTAKRLREQNEQKRKKSLTAEDISDLLANPTKVVTEEELKATYGYVLRDLRSMAILAAVSFAVLIALAVLLPNQL